MTTHVMFDGKLQLYRRGASKVWQCAARVGGERFRETTRETELAQAKDIAEEWYLGLRGQLRSGQIVRKEKTFGEVAEEHMRQARVLAQTVRSPKYTVRSPKYIEGMELRARAHVLPYFGKTSLSEINRGLVQTYRVKRAEETIAATLAAGLARIDRDAAKKIAQLEKDAAESKGRSTTSVSEERARILASAAELKAKVKGKPPARSTTDHEMVFIRQVLKHAEGMGWLSHIPNLEMPYRSKPKRERRAWFSPDEYDRLRKAIKAKIKDGGRKGWEERYEDLHDFVLFVANTGLRPDEALRLEIRDVAIENDYATKQTILVIDVRGKTGVGYCKSMPNAVHTFERLRARRIRQLNKPLAVTARPSRSKNPTLRGQMPTQTEARELLPTDLVFPNFSRDAFNAILVEQGLKYDRDGRVRTAYSLRHTYICMRLMDGADVREIANNCRTSIQMIEQFYAAHIKDRLDASAINVRRPRAARKASTSRKEHYPQDDSSALGGPI
ncbi:MAG: site-specific integrase [Caulobacter sp.]